MLVASLPCSRPRHGFNLIEAAVVLGVVGLVIGGIWTAASAVSVNIQNAQSARALLQTVYSIRHFYADRKWSAELQVGAGQTNIANLAESANLIAPDIKRNSAGRLELPSGHQVWGISIMAPPMVTQTNIYIQINPIPQEYANKLILELHKAGRQHIRRIFCNRSGEAAVDYAWNLNAPCPANTNNLVLYFYLTE